VASQRNPAGLRRRNELLLNDVLRAFEAVDDIRFGELIGSAVRHLHAFASEVKSPPLNGRQPSSS
jgi:hypothetical protein